MVLIVGKISRLSIENKVAWVLENEYNIINYDNKILLTQAKDKITFLAFCIEYNNYTKAKTNPNTFNTSLPIQLDATCNGYQHLALLSQ